MVPGEIYLANFPFGAGGGMKMRPVLVLTGPIGTVPELLVAYISSVQPGTALSSDIILDPNSSDHSGTNLKTVSVLRLHKLATIHGRSLARFLGHISPPTKLQVDDKLRMLLGL